MGFGNSEQIKKTDVFIQKVISSADLYTSKWKEERYSSKKIVKEVKRIAGKGRYCVESCSVLLALEKRIAERYSTIISTLLHYFSWKREVGLLNGLKKLLKIPNNVTVERYVRTFDDPRNSEGDEGERSGEDKGEDEKAKAKEKVEQSPVEENVNLEEVKNLSDEQPEEEREEEKEIPPEQKEEIKEEADRQFSQDHSEKENEDFSEKVVEDDKTEYDRKKSSEPKFMKKAQESSDLPPDEQSEKKKNVSAYENGFDKVCDVPLEFYGINAKETQAKTSDNFYYEHYDRIQERTESLPKTDLTDMNANKNGRVDLSEKEEKEERYFHRDLQRQPQRQEQSQNEKRTETAFNKQPMSEENKARLEARDAFSKMSEEELTAIKNAMQESLNREMDVAESNGEIFKMPITVFEALDISDSVVSDRKQEAPSVGRVIKK